MAKKAGKFEREFTGYVDEYPFKILARGIDEILRLLSEPKRKEAKAAQRRREETARYGIDGPFGPK
jgi:soluble cytochrome b562